MATFVASLGIYTLLVLSYYKIQNGGRKRRHKPKDAKRRQKTPHIRVYCPHFSVIRLLKNTVVNGGRKSRPTRKDAKKL